MDFSNIVTLSLINCKYCTRLPPLGQLASLWDLTLSGFDSLVSVGAEFYGSFNSTQPFRSLKELRFRNMPKLQQWSCYENETEEDDFTAFPLLEQLEISSCPELEMVLLQLFSLKELLIDDCNKISFGHWDLHKCSSHSKLESFPGMMLLPSTLRSIRLLELQNLKSLDCPGLHHLTSLAELHITDCPNLEGLPESVTKLDINNCPLLEERCRKEQGEDWPKIARIRKIVINLKRIKSREAIEELPSVGI